MDLKYYIDEVTANMSDFVQADTQDIAISKRFASEECSVQRINEITLENFKSAYTPVFLRMLRDEHFESGYINNLDKLIDELIQKNSMTACLWLNDLYVNYYTDNRVLLGLLSVISRIDNPLLRPSLSIIAMASLNNLDIEIRETAIKCFENWGDLSSLNFLKSSKHDANGWINEYKEQVIKYIEKTLS